uniref:Uncharacterized protein n=1 Tax=Bos indicus x Bos taurus TaxID=30522 RepID=A0A4W2IPU0_BOBOX
APRLCTVKSRGEHGEGRAPWRELGRRSAAPGTGQPNLQQLDLHTIAHEVGVLTALAALQVVCDDGEGPGRGIQGALQALLLGQQQLGLGDQLLHLALQLRLPAVHVLQALAHLPRGVLLRALCQLLGLRRQLLALMALPLRLVTVSEGLVVAGIAVLEPLVQQGDISKCPLLGGESKSPVDSQHDRQRETLAVK